MVDSRGRPQKEVPLRPENSGLKGSGSIVRVRKMGAHNGAAFGKDVRKKRNNLTYQRKRNFEACS